MSPNANDDLEPIDLVEFSARDANLIVALASSLARATDDDTASVELRDVNVVTSYRMTPEHAARVKKTALEKLESIDCTLEYTYDLLSRVHR